MWVKRGKTMPSAPVITILWMVYVYPYLNIPQLTNFEEIISTGAKVLLVNLGVPALDKPQGTRPCPFSACWTCKVPANSVKQKNLAT